MRAVLVSHNKKKIAELRAILSARLGEDFELISPDDAGLPEDIEETGSTFEENAFIKARAAADAGYMGIADDSGLSVDALGGEPGIYSARYSGEGANDSSNNALLLSRLDGVPPEKRTARFVSVIVAVMPDGRSITRRGECEGLILEAPRGCDGFGYDPLFLYQPDGLTFAELTAERKNSISHRARAIQAFADALAESGFDV